MAKGSVRKKGKKWYYRFYVEDASGNSVQREFPGSESKSETEAMLRKLLRFEWLTLWPLIAPFSHTSQNLPIITPPNGMFGFITA